MDAKKIKSLQLAIYLCNEWGEVSAKHKFLEVLAALDRGENSQELTLIDQLEKTECELREELNTAMQKIAELREGK